MMYGQTKVILNQDTGALGQAAARDVANTFRRLLSEQENVRVIFAGSESQATFFEALSQEEGIDWSRMVCFNMDEFHEPGMPGEYTVGHQARTQLYDKVRPGAMHLLDHNAPNPQAEARRFEDLLRNAGRVDVLCQGIGMSGHLAFNEPFDTDFFDPQWVKTVDICGQSRQQLMEDPNYMEYGRIPDKAITMTIPALLSARYKFTIVPMSLKREILTKVLATLTPTNELPATILSAVANNLYLDRESCPVEILGKIDEKEEQGLEQG